MPLIALLQDPLLYYSPATPGLPSGLIPSDFPTETLSVGCILSRWTLEPMKLAGFQKNPFGRCVKFVGYHNILLEFFTNTESTE